MSLAEELDQVRIELRDASPEFMLDTCELIGPTQVSDGRSGHTIEDATIATGIWCTYDQISGSAQAAADTVNRQSTHRITMQSTDEAMEINQHYKIKIDARAPNPEMIFEQPIREVKSFSPFVVVQAVLTVGYRRPGSI